MPSLQIRFAGLTLLLLLLWGVTSMEMRRRAAELLPTVNIAVEHTRAAGVSVTRTKNRNGPVDIRNDADEPIFVSVPEGWVRDEVRDAPLASVKGETPSLGFRRWSIPSGATVTFLHTGTWNKMIMRNVSQEPLRLRVVTVDLARNTSTTESTLINNETTLMFQL